MKSKSQFCALEQVYPNRLVEPATGVRIAVLQLATDFVLEQDFRKLSGIDLEVYTSRLAYDGEVTSKGLTRLKHNIAEAASALVPGIDVDVLAFGCTSASMLIGEEQVASLMCKTRAGVPVTNPWVAILASLRYLGAQQIAVLTPYISEINYLLFTKLEDAGFSIAAFGSFQLTRDADIHRIDRSSVTSALHDLLSGSNVDAVILSCTNLRVLDYIEEMEQTFRVPMVTSNQSLFWHANQLAGHAVHRPGHGKLLDGAQGDGSGK